MHSLAPGSSALCRVSRRSDGAPCPVTSPRGFCVTWASPRRGSRDLSAIDYTGHHLSSMLADCASRNGFSTTSSMPWTTRSFQRFTPPRARSGTRCTCSTPWTAACPPTWRRGARKTSRKNGEDVPAERVLGECGLHDSRQGHRRQADHAWLRRAVRTDALALALKFTLAALRLGPLTGSEHVPCNRATRTS